MSKYSKLCEFCSEESIFTSACYFCKKLVCSREAHYIASKEETIRGVRTKVLRICPDCKPEDLKKY